MDMPMTPAAEVTAANDRALAPLLAMRARYYTLASEALRIAGGVSAIVAFTALPANARARMVAAARSFHAATRSHLHAARATEGLVEAMTAWNIADDAATL